MSKGASTAPEPADGISVDLDDTLYRVRRLQVVWRLRHQRGLLVALVAAREKIRHESPFESQAALESREAQLVAPSFGLTVEDATSSLARLRASLPEALAGERQPFAGVRSALEAAHARGLQIGALSDYDPRRKLELLGLDDLPWSATIGAEELGVMKPHRRAFHAMAEAMQVEPHRLVHVGDREDLDVKGALAAGLRAWRFTQARPMFTRAERLFRQWQVSLFESLWGPR